MLEQDSIYFAGAGIIVHSDMDPIPILNFYRKMSLEITEDISHRSRSQSRNLPGARSKMSGSSKPGFVFDCFLLERKLPCQLFRSPSSWRPSDTPGRRGGAGSSPHSAPCPPGTAGCPPGYSPAGTSSWIRHHKWSEAGQRGQWSQS